MKIESRLASYINRDKYFFIKSATEKVYLIFQGEKPLKIPVLLFKCERKLPQKKVYLDLYFYLSISFMIHG